MFNFSFDEWAALYKSNPDEFERRRKDTTESEILKSPIENRDKLRIIQMECDVIHQTMEPLEATIEISKIMISKLNKLKTPLTQIRAICDDIDEE